MVLICYLKCMYLVCTMYVPGACPITTAYVIGSYLVFTWYLLCKYLHNIYRACTVTGTYLVFTGHVQVLYLDYLYLVHNKFSYFFYLPFIYFLWDCAIL